MWDDRWLALSKLYPSCVNIFFYFVCLFVCLFSHLYTRVWGWGYVIISTCRPWHTRALPGLFRIMHTHIMRTGRKDMWSPAYSICVNRRTYSVQCSDKISFPQLHIKCDVAKSCLCTHTTLQAPMYMMLNTYFRTISRAYFVAGNNCKWKSWPTRQNTYLPLHAEFLEKMVFLLNRGKFATSNHPVPDMVDIAHYSVQANLHSNVRYSSSPWCSCRFFHSQVC